MYFVFVGAVLTFLDSLRLLPVCVPWIPVYCDIFGIYIFGSLVVGTPMALWYNIYQRSHGKEVEIPMSEVKPHRLPYVDLKTGKKKVLRVNNATRRDFDQSEIQVQFCQIDTFQLRQHRRHPAIGRRIDSKQKEDD